MEAVQVGFEPTVRFRTAVFKTATLNLSDTAPYILNNSYRFT